MASPDITNDIPFDIGQPTLPTNIYYNTGIQYDVAVGGLPFILATSDTRPYERVTAPYRKQQFDNSSEPGEQSLTGWWIRSQSSFHRGAGIKYYDPSAGEEVLYRFNESEGVNVWTPGETTLLRDSLIEGYTSTPVEPNGRSVHRIDTIEWLDSGVQKDGILYTDKYSMSKILSDGTITPFQAYNGTVDDRIYASCVDGTNAYWIVNTVSGGLKATMYKKVLSAGTSTSPTQMWQSNSIIASNAVLEYTKERIMLALNNAIYELTPVATALPSPVYTHPDTAYVWTSFTSSPNAIYASGFSGSVSSIVRFTLTTAGAIPTLSSAITAAELPQGEVVHKIRHYLGFLVIGTSRGVRVAQVAEDGSLTYGPLLFETDQPVHDITVQDRFAWCASNTTTGKSGLVRIDLSTQVAPLQFAYANDLFFENGEDITDAVACGFMGQTGRLAWATAAGFQNTITNKELTSNVATLTTGSAHGYKAGDRLYITGVGAPFNTTLAPGNEVVVTDVPTNTTFSYALTAADVASAAVSPAGFVIKAGYGFIESADVLMESGYVQTGRIRFGTLEPKHFKRFDLRGLLEYGQMQVNVLDEDGAEYQVINYTPAIGTPEVSISPIQSSREWLAFKMILRRDSVTDTFGPTLNGYQIKALPASPRQHLIQVPVFIYDVERDRFNNETGYFGRAHERLILLEELDATGDEVVFQDFTTGEQFTCVIEEFSFRGQTPPDKRFSGFGGFANIIVRKL